jgi:hypothetical protein
MVTCKVARLRYLAFGLKEGIMFSYKWPVDCGYETRICKASFSDGWKRIGSCNAVYAHFVRDPSPATNATRERYRVDEYFLVSYCSPIMRIYVVSRKEDDSVLAVNMHVNEEQYRCSNSTIRHVSRFLRMVSDKHDLDLSYIGLKHVMLSTRMHFFYDCHYAEGSKCHVWRESAEGMESMFKEREAPEFTDEFV